MEDNFNWLQWIIQRFELVKGGVGVGCLLFFYRTILITN